MELAEQRELELKAVDLNRALTTLNRREQDAEDGAVGFRSLDRATYLLVEAFILKAIQDIRKEIGKGQNDGN